MFIRKLKRLYRKPDDDLSGGGGTVDRGDDFTATDDDAIVATKLDTSTQKTADELEAEIVADKAKKESALKGDKGDETLTDDEKAAKVIADAEAAAKDKTKDTRIPAARHKEILDKEREKRTALETELAQYKQGKQIAEVNTEITEAETKLIKMEKDYSTLIADGKAAEGAALMTDIRRLERTINNKTAEMRETAATARAVEQTRYDTTCDRLEALYPALDTTHADFDKVKTGEVLELKEAYQLKGYTPSQALQKAVKLIMPPVTKAQESALNTEARVDTAKIEADRKAAAVKATADAVNKTPANAAKVGKEHDAAGGGAVTAKDAMKMPYADFVKLDENQLAVMRGDVL